MLTLANWHRVIQFEDTELPGVAIAIDHLAKPQNLPEMSEETSLWLWRFTICVGLPRTEPSAAVSKHAGEALAEQFRERLIETVPHQYDISFTPDVIDAWIDTLRSMIRIASSRDNCTWVAKLRPGDAAYGRENSEIIHEMGMALGRATRNVIEGESDEKGSNILKIAQPPAAASPPPSPGS